MELEPTVCQFHSYRKPQLMMRLRTEARSRREKPQTEHRRISRNTEEVAGSRILGLSCIAGYPGEVSGLSTSFPSRLSPVSHPNRPTANVIGSLSRRPYSFPIARSPLPSNSNRTPVPAIRKRHSIRIIGKKSP